MGKKDFFDNDAMITPAFLGIVATFVTNFLYGYVPLSAYLIVLVVSFAFSLIVVFWFNPKNISYGKKIRFTLSNWFVVFIFAIASNNIGRKLSVSVDNKLMNYNASQLVVSVSPQTSKASNNLFFKDWVGK